MYEAIIPFEDNTISDKEVFDPPAYRAAFIGAKRSSVFDDDSSVTTFQSHHGRLQRQPTMEFPSDHLPEQWSMDTGDTGDEIGDLIYLVEDFISWTETPSARLKDLECLCRETSMVPTVAQLLGEDFLRTLKTEAELRIKSIDTNEADSIHPLSSKLKNLTAQEYMDEIGEQGSSRDSGYTSTSQGSKFKVGSSDQSNHVSRTLDTRKTASIHIPEGKVAVWIGEQKFSHSYPATTTLSSGIDTHGSSTNNSTLSPLVGSPFFERPLPFDQRLGDLSALIPPSDKEVEDSLFKTMSQVLYSPKPATRLDWAEDVLRHCTISVAHAIRMAKIDPRSSAGKPLLSDLEDRMLETTLYIVKELQHAREGRAYFLGARYIESGETMEALHLLAYSSGYSRSLFYLGKLSEERKLMEEAKKRYEDGAEHEDPACLLALAQAHLNGKLGVKKDKQKGLSLLQRAAASADKDCPDPLHELALLHLEAPASKLKSGFKISNLKPLVPYDPSTAIELLRKASLLGHAPSQLRLGQLYLAGPRNMSKKLSRKGSLRRDSQTSASTDSLVSSNLETDPTLARHYLYLAARRGLTEADYEIARDIIMSRHDPSKLSKADAQLAVIHASRALFDKVPLAYGIMGKIYEDGIGRKRDFEKAEKLYFEGGKKGDGWARKRSDELRNRGVGVAGADAIYKRDWH
ncbi:HCP-like protein [Venturia nashicola]|uniref:HCP-like protein n=1 Tax=Venturia nashicola TaxID=86259 RepID=A0A4Z1PMM6_9PEZI|nr:HCP-like protein [Venturia nashicola]